MAKVCPICDGEYDGGAQRCEVDDAVLVDVSPSDPLLGVELDGRFTLRAHLGEGGMGAVYRAHQSSMDRDVAVKVMHAARSGQLDAVKRFYREARAASRLAHPNTITVHDFGQSEQGLLYLVMELVDGRPLSDLLHRGLLVGAAVDVLMQVCDSVADAHRAGILHRDLKPDNVMVSRKIGNENHAKVLDFGIAKLLGGDLESQSLTGTGAVCGTSHYMAPEVAMGQDAGPESDVYSLGVMLYEMLAGRLPFRGDTAAQIMLAHVQQPVPPLPGTTPPALAEVAYAALRKSPEERIPDPLALKRALAAAVDDGAVALPAYGVSGVPATEAPRPPAPEADPRPLARSAFVLAETADTSSPLAAGPADTSPPPRARWWLAAIVAVAAVVGALAWLRPQEPVPPDPDSGAPAAAAEAAGDVTTVSAAPAVPVVDAARRAAISTSRRTRRASARLPISARLAAVEAPRERRALARPPRARRPPVRRPPRGPASPTASATDDATQAGLK